MRLSTLVVSLVALIAVVSQADAALIVHSLGNTTPGFADGSFPTTPTLALVQGGQPVPFDKGYGNEVLGPSFSQPWTHNYGAIANPIVSATLTFGMADHDSAASGSQLSQFTLDGTALTAPLNTLMEAAGVGQNNEYNVFTLDLLANGVTTASLADGMLGAQLNLQGPGLAFNLLLGIDQEVTHNGAHLIFSTLTIQTLDDPATIPEPASVAIWSLMGLAAFGYGWRKRRR